MLPIPVKNLLVRSRDGWRLGQETIGSCDAGPLRRLTAGELTGAFADPRVHQEWPMVEAEVNRFQITTSAGGVNLGDRRALYYLLRWLRPRRSLEVGTHIGASTVHLAAALRANRREAPETTPTLTTVDIVDVNDATARPWVGYGSVHSPAELIAKVGMVDAVRFVAQGSLAFLRAQGEPFDFIFLDGDHSAATVYREVPAAIGRLAPGGVILLHDYFPGGRPLWPGDPVIYGPWLAIDRLRREGAALQILPLGDLPWPTKLGRSVTSLAILAHAD
jgi:predicted O-methyltransferase YrrM